MCRDRLEYFDTTDFLVGDLARDMAGIVGGPVPSAGSSKFKPVVVDGSKLKRSRPGLVRYDLTSDGDLVRKAGKIKKGGFPVKPV